MILRNELITPVYQPIVNLKNGKIFAYEALSRGPKESCLHMPDRLFTAAAQKNCLQQLDCLCHNLAIRRVKDLLNGRKLFLNINARSLYDENFHHRTSEKFLQRYHLTAKDIVFEISEKETIDNYKTFCPILKSYQFQGYKIAIDDVGAGYNGLNFLAQISPQFIKIDIGLVKDIDKNHMQKSIVRALISFAQTNNIKIIAEGIERKEELTVLIGLGIEYGQGFLLGKPQPALEDINMDIVRLIQETHREKENARINTLRNTTIGEIAARQIAFSPETPGHIIIDYLRSMQEPLDVIIVEDNQPVGILNHNIFYQQLTTIYGMSVYSNRPIRLLMNHDPLVVDYTESIEDASQQALNRQTHHTYDAIIVVKDNKYYGTVTIKKLLEITTKLEVSQARHANPLTGLPGNNVIESMMAHYINNFKPFAVIYIDIDNFKVYNDIYGFEAGDNVLIAVAKLLHITLTECIEQFFLGHIGGDDFIAFIPIKEIQNVCQIIINKFDERIKSFYSAEHQQQKYIIAQDRNGQVEKFPLMTISLAVVSIKVKDRLTSTLLASKAAAIKKKCKSIPVSNFIVNDYGTDNYY